jgi:hypothetical protein
MQPQQRSQGPAGYSAGLGGGLGSSVFPTKEGLHGSRSGCNQQACTHMLVHVGYPAAPYLSACAHHGSRVFRVWGTVIKLTC